MILNKPDVPSWIQTKPEEEPFTYFGEAGYYNGGLWIALYGKTLSETAAIIFARNALNHIEYRYANIVEIYEGFTEVRTITGFEDRTEVRLGGGTKRVEVVKREGDSTEDGTDVVPASV